MPEKKDRSRLEELKEIGSEKLKIPIPDWGVHLIDSLFDFGPSFPSMNGPVPVPYSEIEAWMRSTNLNIPSYEVALLKQLSRDYCNQYHKSKNPAEPMPAMPNENHRVAVLKGFADLFKKGKK